MAETVSKTIPNGKDASRFYRRRAKLELEEKIWVISQTKV